MTPDLMEASFSLYSGWERRTLKLDPGDKVRLRLEQHLESGSIRCEVTAPDESTVLTLGDAPAHEGALQATVEGKYSVRVFAQDARGSYRLMLLPD